MVAKFSRAPSSMKIFSGAITFTVDRNRNTFSSLGQQPKISFQFCFVLRKYFPEVFQEQWFFVGFQPFCNIFFRKRKTNRQADGWRLPVRRNEWHGRLSMFVSAVQVLAWGSNGRSEKWFRLLPGMDILQKGILPFSHEDISVPRYFSHFSRMVSIPIRNSETGRVNVNGSRWLRHWSSNKVKSIACFFAKVEKKSPDDAELSV